MSETFFVQITGRLNGRMQRAAVIGHAAKVFKVEPARAEGLLQDQPTVIRQNLPSGQAEKIRKMLEARGMEAEILPDAASDYQTTEASSDPVGNGSAKDGSTVNEANEEQVSSSPSAETSYAREENFEASESEQELESNRHTPPINEQNSANVTANVASASLPVQAAEELAADPAIKEARSSPISTQDPGRRRQAAEVKTPAPFQEAEVLFDDSGEVQPEAHDESGSKSAESFVADEHGEEHVDDAEVPGATESDYEAVFCPENLKSASF